MRTELCSKTAHPLSPFYPERGQCRAVRISESVETPEGTFAERHGCARIDAELHTPGRAYFPRRAIKVRRRVVRISENQQPIERDFRACVRGDKAAVRIVSRSAHPDREQRTRNEMRSAVRVRSSALLMPIDEQDTLHRKGPGAPVAAWQQ
jgi:hypothetical protein